MVKERSARLHGHRLLARIHEVVVFFAGWLAAVNRARIKRIGDLFGGFIRERLNQPSFAELILPKIELDAVERILRLPGVQLADDEYTEYEIDDNNVVTIWITNESGESRIYALMDKETFEALRNEQHGTEAP